MKNVLMILFLVFSFQLSAEENESSEGSGSPVLGEGDASVTECTDQVDSNRGQAGAPEPQDRDGDSQEGEGSDER